MFFRSQKAQLSAIFLLGTIGSVTNLWASDLPYIGIAVIWMLVGLFAFHFCERRGFRAFWFSFSIFWVAIGVGEYVLRPTAPFVDEFEHRIEGSYNEGYFVPYELLGYGAPKSVKKRSTYFRGKEVLYEVVYTLDENGLRTGLASHDREDQRECIFFFGGSFTFGEGVDDQETLPHQVELATERRYRCYNFGFHGYGAHQMLAILENELEGRIVDCRPGYGIYLALPEHAARAAGRAVWDTAGPRYVLENDGELLFVGRFDDQRTFEQESEQIGFLTKFRNSSILRKINEHGQRIDDISLFLGIVERSKAIFEKRYPGSEFHVLLWDAEDSHSCRLVRGLEKRGITVHRISRIVPDVLEEKYRIPYDNHPTSLLYTELAEYIVETIVAE